MLSGSKAKTGGSSFSYGGAMSPAVTPTGASPSHGGTAKQFGGGRTKDAAIGKTVSITKGAYKGFQVLLFHPTQVMRILPLN